MSRRGLGAPRVSHETAPSRGPPGRMGQHLSPSTAARPRLRHDLRPEPTGWTGYDTTNGQPVRLDGTALIDLIQRAARRLVLEAKPRGPARPTTSGVRGAAH